MFLAFFGSPRSEEAEHAHEADGETGQQLPGPIGSFFAYDPSFTGGIFVAAIDMNDVESIEVDEGSSGALVGFNVHFHSLGSATLTVMFN